MADVRARATRPVINTREMDPTGRPPFPSQAGQTGAPGPRTAALATDSVFGPDSAPLSGTISAGPGGTVGGAPWRRVGATSKCAWEQFRQLTATTIACTGSTN